MFERKKKVKSIVNDIYYGIISEHEWILYLKYNSAFSHLLWAANVNISDEPLHRFIDSIDHGLRTNETKELVANVEHT